MLFVDKTALYVYAASSSEKEDWFFALRQAARDFCTSAGGEANAAPPPPFSPHTSQSLAEAVFMERVNRYVRGAGVERSCEWVNAIAGRVYYNVFRSSDLERFFRKKFERKAASAARPFFLGELRLRSVSPGQSLPLLSKGQLHSLSPQGELLVSVDLFYPGGFRMQIETEIRWDIPKVRTIVVPILVLVHVRRMTGRALIRIKPPPSDRIWLGFYSPPHLDLDIEPIVSSKAITWSVVKNALLRHVQDTLAEFVVLPNMEDFALPPLMVGDAYGGERPFDLDYIPPTLLEHVREHDLTAHGLSSFPPAPPPARQDEPCHRSYMEEAEALLASGLGAADERPEADLAMDPLGAIRAARRPRGSPNLYDEARRSDHLAQERTRERLGGASTASPDALSAAGRGLGLQIPAEDGAASRTSSPHSTHSTPLLARTPIELISSVRRSLSTFFHSPPPSHAHSSPSLPVPASDQQQDRRDRTGKSEHTE